MTSHLEKLAGEEEKEAKEIDGDIEDAEHRLKALKRILSAREEKAGKRRKLLDCEKEIAVLEATVGNASNHDDFEWKPVLQKVEDGSSGPIVATAKAVAEEVIIDTRSDPGHMTEASDPTAPPSPPSPLVTSGVNHQQYQSRLQVTAQPVRHSHNRQNEAPKTPHHVAKDKVSGNTDDKPGEWYVKSAKALLGSHLDNPLIQTTINYFDLFMTETMLENLARTLTKNVNAATNLDSLRRAWGNEKTDYFLQCAKYKPKRKSYRALNWNKYYQNGYLVHKHGGPSVGDHNMSLERYRELHKAPLFGYGNLSPGMPPADMDPASLSKLYQAYLRTEAGSMWPCLAHLKLGLLGFQDKCWVCGVKGTVRGLS